MPNIIVLRECIARAESQRVLKNLLAASTKNYIDPARGDGLRKVGIADHVFMRDVFAKNGPSVLDQSAFRAGEGHNVVLLVAYTLAADGRGSILYYVRSLVSAGRCEFIDTKFSNIGIMREVGFIYHGGLS